MTQWIELSLSILSGLLVCIPLVIKLVEYVKKAYTEKNWQSILELVMSYMVIAEKKYEKGEDKKAYVLAMIQASSITVEYDVDMEVISAMIDNLCKMSKSINV